MMPLVSFETDVRQRGNRADAYQVLGNAYAALAASPKTSASESKTEMSAARDMFQQALNVLDDLHRRGILAPSEQGSLKELADQIVKCNAALAK